MKKLFLFPILILLFFFFLPLVKTVRAAYFFLEPGASSVTVGNNFTVKVKVNTGGENVSQLKASIGFPASLLDFISADKTDSFVANWLIEDTATSGVLQYAGGLSTPGFSGANSNNVGTFINLTFRAKTAGTAVISFASTSYIYKDIPGSTTTTDILNLSSSTGGTYALSAVGSPALPTAIPTPASSLPKAGTFENSLILLGFGLFLSFFSLLRLKFSS